MNILFVLIYYEYYRCVMLVKKKGRLVMLVRTGFNGKQSFIYYDGKEVNGKRKRL